MAMKVKILIPFVLHDGRSFSAGQEAEIADVDAKGLAKVGYAKQLKADGVPTKSVAIPVVETREDI